MFTFCRGFSPRKPPSLVGNLVKYFSAFLCSILALVSPAGAQVAPLPAFEKGTHVLFQGDSITDGNRGRNADPNHILGHGYAFIIAAKYGAEFPQLGLAFTNRGISGNTVLNLSERWQKDTLDLKPDILSILVGVNDSGKSIPVDQYEAVYDKLLTDTLAANPKVKLVLCAPFGLPVGKKKEIYETWSADLRARQGVVEKLAKKHHAALVQLQAVFEDASKRAPAETWIWDGVHPTYAGHQLIADEWVKTVLKLWPTKQP